MDRRRERRASSCEVVSGEGFVFHFSSWYVTLRRATMDSFLKLFIPVFLQTQICPPMLLQHREESDFMAFLFWLFLWHVLSKHRSKKIRTHQENYGFVHPIVLYNNYNYCKYGPDTVIFCSPSGLSFSFSSSFYDCFLRKFSYVTL